MLCEKCRANIERREIPFPKGTKLRVPDATFGVVEGAEFHARSRYGEFVELGNRHVSDPDRVYVHPYNKKGEPQGVLIMGFDVLECCEIAPEPFEAAAIRVIAT
jgi:hypothetical protein